ncbi:MAG: FKBP-type peptidyl-prolyl cis-trans isomerase, partial [Clostridia bacterium]|nr:FKBP-type peptidyl-prolyl cis-trans isomerase [Clostridia bacterium]
MNMKTNKLLYILAGALLSFCVLASCGTSASSDQETTTETDTGAEIATGATTSAETTAETKEEVTQMPRYDYFEAEVGPDVTLDKSVYASMKLELPKSLLVTDEQVQTYLNYLIFQEREAVNGDTKVYDQPLKLGDTAYIYYRGTVDGKEFEGGSNMEDKTSYGLGLGSGSFIPGFEEGLVGVIPNQTSKDNPAEVHVTFSEDYNAELGGKDAIFYVYVEYAVQYTLPEYTREFVEKTLKYESEKVHVTEKSFLAEFEAYLKTYIEDQNKENVEAAKTDALWTYLTEKVVCVNLPQMELDYYTTSYLNEINAAYEYYSTGAS